MNRCTFLVVRNLTCSYTLYASKVVSVYYVVRLGWDAMFQDADVVWWKDPRPYFQTESHQYDTYWQVCACSCVCMCMCPEQHGIWRVWTHIPTQDDGARSSRYTPLSANTGFYYIRSNERTKIFMVITAHTPVYKPGPPLDCPWIHAQTAPSYPF